MVRGKNPAGLLPKGLTLAELIEVVRSVERMRVYTELSASRRKPGQRSVVTAAMLSRAFRESELEFPKLKGRARQEDVAGRVGWKDGRSVRTYLSRQTELGEWARAVVGLTEDQVRTWIEGEHEIVLVEDGKQVRPPRLKRAKS